MTSRDVLFQGHVTIYEGGVQIYFRVCVGEHSVPERVGGTNGRIQKKCSE